MWFFNWFEVEVMVVLDINFYMILIFIMLLQFFVENVINYGLFYKMVEGKLSFNIVKDKNQMLICMLEDNGVGCVVVKGIQ